MNPRLVSATTSLLDSLKEAHAKYKLWVAALETHRDVMKANPTLHLQDVSLWPESLEMFRANAAFEICKKEFDAARSESDAAIASAPYLVGSRESLQTAPESVNS